MTGKKDILSRLSQAVIEYNANDAAFWASTAIEAGIDPTEALHVLMDAIRQIGRQYASGELFLPDLRMPGEAMRAGVAILEAEIKQAASSPRARTLIVGTVAEDLHDIGKSPVGTMFLGARYRVIDLGIDGPTSRLPEAIRLYGPDLLGLSALLSTTALEQRKVIEALIETGLRNRVKVMVGGGAVTQEFSERIGADGHADTAPEAVLVGERLYQG